MRSQRGFSLIELLFALLILTLVFTTTLAMFTERNRRLQTAADVMLAYQVLGNEAEVVRRTSFGALETLSDNFVTDTSLLRPLAPFRTQVEVKTVRPGVKSVTLTIKWAAAKEAQLSLFRTDTGGSNLW
jgi:prepilin-type N-terminal cleavage/methylation domain-containing protein